MCRTLRKRPEPPPVSETQQQTAKKAAVEALKGLYNGSAREAAEHFGLLHANQVQYWMTQLRGTEVVELLPTPEPASSPACR